MLDPSALDLLRPILAALGAAAVLYFVFVFVSFYFAARRAERVRGEIRARAWKDRR